MRRALAILTLCMATPALGQTVHSHGHEGKSLREGGQSAFAAIAEIVARLDADPATDWARVDIAALAAHLADMERVFTEARVIQVDTAAGAEFTVTGTGETVGAIRRMARAHATTMPGDWRFDVAEMAGGATVAVTAPEAARPRLRAIGYLGLLADGDHHRAHHWAMAMGDDPHSP